MEVLEIVEPEMKLRYPAMRQELLDAVSQLAAPQDVRDVPPGVNWILENYTLLYEDAELGDAPTNAIGVTLYDRAEAEALAAVADALHAVIQEAGPYASEPDYMASQAWKTVVTEARTAHSILSLQRQQQGHTRS